MASDGVENAPEIAGFAAVVAAVIPWSVSFSADGFSAFIAFRFVFGSLRFDFGSRAADVTWSLVSVTAVGTRYGEDLARMVTLWFVAAVLLVVALALGVVLFGAGERFATGLLDPVRIMGVLCLFTALVLSGASWLLWQNTSRVLIPLGVIVLYFFAGRLLTVDRGRAGHVTTETSG
jgi:uncharacterized protein (TIGR04206 family)